MTKPVNLLRVTEAANKVGMSRQRLWLYIQDGRLATTEKHGMTLVSQREIDRFIKDRDSGKLNKPNGRPKLNGKGRKNGK